jgi:hypothetical protein
MFLVFSPQRRQVDGAAASVRSLHEASGQRVVVLVDEYDKPILDNITEPDQAGPAGSGGTRR